MKKISIFLVALLLVGGMAASSFAQGSQHKKTTVVIRGVVVNIDAVKKEITVKDGKTGQDSAFAVSEKAVSTVKVGERVKIRVKEGSNVAESVTVVKTQGKNK